jgi:ATP synthase protein I
MNSSQLKSNGGSDGIPVFRIVWFQLIGTLVAALAFLLLDLVSAYSVLLGGLVCVIPNAFMAQRFVSAISLERGRVFGRLIAGEAGKLLLTAGLFVLVFALVEPLHMLLFFGSLFVVQLLSWAAPVLLQINRVQENGR